jgi:argininosuccinate synthase
MLTDVPSAPSTVSSGGETARSGTSRALVLLSGGLGAVAAMHWACDRYDDVRAIAFDLGQRHAEAELASPTFAAGADERSRRA